MRCKRHLPYRCDLSVSDWLTTITSVGNMQSRITAKKAGVINKAARKVQTQCNDIVTTGPISVPHLDLEIRGGGGIQTLRYVGGHFFRPFGPQFGLTERGSWAPGPLPWIRRWIWLTEEIKTLAMFTLSVQAQFWSTMLAESTRGYLSVNTPVLCIQDRSEFRCGASTRSRPCTTTTARFSVGTDVNSTVCMHAYIVSLEVRICLLTVHFFFLAQNGAIASIMDNIRCKVLESASAILWLLCRFCGNCVRTLHQV